ARADSLYPIELGYDVSGRKLHPSYGEWKLIAKTDASVVAADYDLNVPNGNDGAGNAFKTVGSGIGGLLFQYDAKSEQCGLDPGQKYWVYVFILPDYNDIVNPTDTVVCFEKKTGATSPEITINFNETFKQYLDLYTNAGFKQFEWASKNRGNGEYKLRKDSVATYSLVDSILLTKGTKPAEYSCGDTVIFKIVVRVDSIFKLGSSGVGLCKEQLEGDLGNRNPNEIFKHNVYGAQYAPDKIGLTGWSSNEISNGYKIFVYSYTTCDPKGNDGKGSGTVNDTIYLYDDGPYGNWGKDTIVYCRDSVPASIFNMYFDSAINYPNMPKGKPYLTVSNSYWYDRDLGQIPFTFPPYNTTSGASSLDVQTNLPDPNDLSQHEISGYSLQLGIMKSNIGYNYLWKVDPGAFPCLTNEDGVPDSGTMVVIIQDPAIAQDYTAQLCKSSYVSQSTDFDLNLYAGLSVMWTPETNNPHLENDNSTLKVGTIAMGTYKYKYSIPAGCGPGGKGVFYLKITNQVKAPVSKTVQYCIAKLPASINLNDVLGVAVSGLTWTGKIPDAGAGTTLDSSYGFESNGTLDIAKFIAKKKDADPVDLEFTIAFSDAKTCGISSSTKLTLKFVTTLQ
ncbi:MAG: hypothetical protein LBL79_04405, partial [Prevotella sp.]|nr:hypothetical protein [Prevotella sp.]